jgi:general secretion pathway protein I
MSRPRARPPVPAGRGFTLVETMVALVILSTSLILLSGSWTGSYSRIRRAQLNFVVSALLERKMTEIELEYRGKPISSIPEDKSDDFGDEGFPEYSWEMKSKELELPDISSAMTAQEGGADQLTMSLVKQLTEGISKSVKEVQVTVIYKTGKKEPAQLKWSVTAYFIDFDREFQFGIPGS